MNRRDIKHWWQRRTRGWDDSDTWSLDGVIATFALPRLRRFRELHGDCPLGMTMEAWDAMLDDMIYAMEVCVREMDEVVGREDADWERVDRGLEAFGTMFRDLWW